MGRDNSWGGAAILELASMNIIMFAFVITIFEHVAYVAFSAVL